MSSSSDEELIVRNPYASGAGRRTSRRSRTSRDQESKTKALEEMKRARESGGVHRVDVANLVKPVYEEVDEEEYMKIVRQRQNDDFVVDDDGAGYIDHGIDFFDEEEENTAKKEKKKPREKKDKSKRKVIDDFFHAGNLKKAKKDESILTVVDDPDVEALLNECDLSNPLKKVPEEPEEMASSSKNVPYTRNPYLRDPETAVKFAPKPIKSAKVIQHKKPSNIAPAPKHLTSTTNLEENSRNVKFSQRESDEVMEESHNSAADTSEQCEPTTMCDDIMSVETTSFSEKCEKENVMEETDAAEPEISFDWADSTKNDDEGESVVAMDKPMVLTGNEPTMSSFMRTNAEGKPVLRFYWLDAFEDPGKIPGTVYLFGRLMHDGVSESCCIVVKNIWRQVFFLPREKRLTKTNIQTDVPVDLSQVNDEVQKILRKMGVQIVKCKPCEKKFAYNDGIVPQNAQVLEVQYPFTAPRLSVNVSGETFSHVFNTTATAMERLLIETGMKGPSWIEISDCAVSSPQVSYAKREFTLDMERMRSLSVIDCPDPTPKLKLLTINIVTSVNEKKENEIVMISCILDQQCSTENPTVDRNRLERFCILTKPTHCAYPFDLKIALKHAKMDTIVYETMNERHMLNQFLCKLQNLDPDAYAGHDLTAQFAVLSSRMEKLKIAHWSRLGRLKRSITIKQAARSKTSQWELTAGRLVLDSRMSAMELVRMRSYDLSELSSNLLGINRDATIMSQNISAHFGSSQHLIKLINNSWMDAWLSVAVLTQLNALPLFIQITQIVGGVLSRTLMGGRAERNEYLLLHAFNKAGYVAPNKYQPDFKKRKSEAPGATDIEDGDAVADVTKDDSKALSRNRKAQYIGGLVLEPKTGLYDTFILLLDFNSLYPSIIQEYNICFTTVDQSKKHENEIPELPSDTTEGILPREIRALVERRREVKKLMNSENLTKQQRQQYDIRQMGLKLTANSMYGCLGFQQSRFYAKPLAALITSRGREILMHTKDLIENTGYSVIYGDTDSVMINTGLSGRSELEQAKKLGNDIKKVINRCHRKLEIDIDGIFVKLLLLKKKKYAGLAIELNNETKTKRELKGLDIIRRDYSFIAKKIGEEIVDIILSEESQSHDEITDRIHSRLQKLGDEIAKGLIDASKFQILKQLTRNPDEYADINVQPHAAVARRLNATGKFKFHQGDTVGYIICEDGSGKSSTQRAYHLSELLANKDLKIDLQYYLTQQIHPVVSRLCVPIEECNEAWIAKALGLDDSAYRRRTAAVHDENMGGEANDDQLPTLLQLDFDHCQPFTFSCPCDGCTHEFSVSECLQHDDNGELKLWLSECPACRGHLLPFGAYLNNQLKLALDQAIIEYRKSPYVCDDIGCAYRTRALVLGCRREGLPCPRCKSGLMRKERTSKELYEQMIFYQSLFDVTKAMESCTEEQRSLFYFDYVKLRSRNDWKKSLTVLDGLLSLCNQYIADNQYNRVSLAYLFAAMRPF